MIKECVVLNGDVINIGPWDYYKQQVQTGIDGNGSPIYEEQVTNPLPEGAATEEREIEVSPDGGLIVKDSVQPTDNELLGQQLTDMKLQTMQQQQSIENLGAELAAARLEIIALKGENK
jgi:hypothetical protein